MTHTDVVNSLTPEQRKALLRRSDGRGLLRIAVHLSCVIATGLAIQWRVPAWQALLPLQGILIVFLFPPLHESIHRTPFRSRWINTLVANVCGFLIFLAPAWFRRFHTHHHRHTNDPESDPELLVRKPATRAEYLRLLTGIPAWRAQIRRLFANAFRTNDEPFVAASAKPLVKREARCFVAGYAALALASWYFQTTVLVWVWLLPLLFGQPFLRAFLLAEHGGCPNVPNMLENTRTTFTNPLVRFFAWNMPYHAEHHAMPAVPFHNLPRLHEFTKPHLKVTERGYLRFHRRFVKSLARTRQDDQARSRRQA